MHGRRAAIYARYSTELQDGRSIDDQVALCREHAARSGLTVVATYDDRAKTSASIFGRDGLARMMEQARARQFDVVIVEALDRLSRDQEDLAHIHKRLSFARIDILTVHEGVADSVSVGLRGLMGTMFLEALKAKTRRGLAGVIRDGRHAGGQTYGYRVVPGEPGKREIVAHEAEIIREIFAAYVEGKSPRTIAGELNARGIAAPRGPKWNASTLNGNPQRGYGILRNPMYDGRLVWNRVTMVRDPDTGRRVNRENPLDARQEVEAEHLRIVPRPLFEAAVRRHAQQAEAVRTGKITKAPPRPFSGLIRCACCGGGMSIHDRCGEAIRIRCSTANESGSCENKARYRLEKIEEAIFHRLRAQLDRPDYLKEFVRVYAEERRRLTETARRDRARLERAAADSRARYMRLVDMMARGLIEGEEADAQVLQAKQAAEMARSELEIASSEDNVVELHPQATAAYMRAIADLSAALQRGDGTFDATSVEALRRIITEITVHPKDETGDVLVEVRGNMERLLGIDQQIVGGPMVARGGLEPPTPRL
ncbi:recombinase family protein [Cereibacter sphaeroides]|uniref:recombinase family protein n=1 Tax=Cereibacter sphaeroides TaxID=1063 RepID=UPI003FCDE3C1